MGAGKKLSRPFHCNPLSNIPTCLSFALCPLSLQLCPLSGVTAVFPLPCLTSLQVCPSTRRPYNFAIHVLLQV
jgi:hypothetical protein